MRYHTALPLLLVSLLRSLSLGLALSSNKNNNFNFQFPWSSNTPNTPPSPPEIQDQQIQLDNGISAQVLSCVPTKNSNNNIKKKYPPLVFLHGSFHAAWCWSEKFFPYFVELGYPVVALSWRGTGGTPAGNGVKKVKASEHCEDLQSFLNQLPEIIIGSSSSSTTTIKPVLLSHSFGGIVVMKYLETLYENENDDDDNQNKKKPSDLFSGIVTMCSVPPSGNGKMTMRFLKRSWSQSWKITAGFAMKKSCTDAALCRELFFGGTSDNDNDNDNDDNNGVSDDDIARYQSYFTRDTEATIDLLDLAKKLPSKSVDDVGRAPFYKDLPPSLVIGATEDFIVDEEGNLETANYYGLEAPVIVDSPHDVMLGAKWQNCADTIHTWIQENVV